MPRVPPAAAVRPRPRPPRLPPRLRRAAGPSAAALGLLLALLGVVLLAGCGRDGGPRTTETRRVAAFTAVDVGGATEATVRRGSRPAVVLRAGRDDLARVRTRVTDGRLTIDTGPDRLFADGVDGPVRAVVVVPELRSAGVHGGARLDLGDRRGGPLTVGVSGGGAVVGAGRAGTLRIVASGGADVDLGRLRADRARVTGSGGAAVRVHVRQRLDAALSGGADVTYGGRPRVVRRGDGGELTPAAR
ncbi:DUF2807 domain-containing protein [Patulibacter sp. SYSU D01012]|uniref:GIN domain-containing protein n=1 Tax=Patulibacter sp. SYSU D01012 TaxID=2817381 RepID=UPI001B30D4A1|nr:DUF2807 domain-containing protein [Patulibacter sp. SYSU D01012]